MPFIESVGVSIANQALGSLWKRCCGLFCDFRRSKRVAALEAEVIDLRSQLDTANAECARSKAVEVAQLHHIEDQKSLQKEHAMLLKDKEEIIRNLTAKIEDANDFKKKVAEFDRTTVTEGGAVVYVNQKEAGVPYSPIYLCPKCYEDKKRSFLQPKDHFSKFCPECGTEYLFKKPAGPSMDIV